MIDKIDTIENNVNSYGLTPEIQQQLDTLLDSGDHESFRQVIDQLREADVADYITISHSEKRKEIINIIKDKFNSDILINIDNSISAQVIDLITPEYAAVLIQEMPLEDAVYVVEYLNKDLQSQILSHLPETKRLWINERLSYPENSAGRMMKHHALSVMEYWTVEQTIEYIRKNKSSDEIFLNIFVLNLRHKPIGSLSLSKLICSNPKSLIGNIADKDPIVIDVNMDREEVSFIFKQYELISAPVVNSNGRIIGTITIDDIIDVVEEETEEDLFHMGGLSDTDLYLPFLASAKKRLPWLIINLITAFISSRVISHFSDEIEKMVILASIMPMVASMGGNAGTQTITIIIRALALKDILDSNTNRVIMKEILASVTNSILIGAIAGGLVYIMYKNIDVSIIFALAILINFFTAGLMGALIPITLNKFKLDPAFASGILLTAITDSVGFCSFLLLAKIFLLN